MVCVETDFLGAKAHEGMSKAAMKILNRIKGQLKEYLEIYPDYKLLLTGHSLGGGVATLMTIAIRHGEIKDYVPPDVPMQCKVFAPPPVFASTENVDHLTSDIESYIQGADCVPRFTLANTAEIFAMLCAIDATDLSWDATIKILRGKQDQKTLKLLQTLIQNMERARREVEEKNEFVQLKLSGQIFYIGKSDFESHEFVHRMFKVSSDFIDDAFLLMEKMIADHTTDLYKKALNELKIN